MRRRKSREEYLQKSHLVIFIGGLGRQNNEELKKYFTNYVFMEWTILENCLLIRLNILFSKQKKKNFKEIE